MANHLLKELAVATGLPEKLIHQELEELIQAAGVSQTEVGLEHLREILASYAQDVLLSAKEHHEQSENS